MLRNTKSKIRTHEQASLNLLLGEKCLKLATLRLIADNISFLGGRLDRGRIAERADQGCWSWSVLVDMVRSDTYTRIGCLVVSKEALVY